MCPKIVVDAKKKEVSFKILACQNIGNKQSSKKFFFTVRNYIAGSNVLPRNDIFPLNDITVAI